MHCSPLHVYLNCHGWKMQMAFVGHVSRNDWQCRQRVSRKANLCNITSHLRLFELSRGDGNAVQFSASVTHSWRNVTLVWNVDCVSFQPTTHKLWAEQSQTAPRVNRSQHSRALHSEPTSADGCHGDQLHLFCRYAFQYDSISNHMDRKMCEK